MKTHGLLRFYRLPVFTWTAGAHNTRMGAPILSPNTPWSVRDKIRPRSVRRLTPASRASFGNEMASFLTNLSRTLRRGGFYSLVVTLLTLLPGFGLPGFGVSGLANEIDSPVSFVNDVVSCFDESRMQFGCLPCQGGRWTEGVFQLFAARIRAP